MQMNRRSLKFSFVYPDSVISGSEIPDIKSLYQRAAVSNTRPRVPHSIRPDRGYYMAHELFQQCRSYSFSSLFILDVATYSQIDHKLFSATHILCSKKIGN